MVPSLMQHNSVSRIAVILQFCIEILLYKGQVSQKSRSLFQLLRMALSNMYVI